MRKDQSFMLLVTPTAPHRVPSPSRGERRLQQDSLNGVLFLLRQEVRHDGGFPGGLCAAAVQGLALGGLLWLSVAVACIAIDAAAP